MTISPMSVTTLSIDLAAESRNTAACRVCWELGQATVEWVRRGTSGQPLDNDALAALMLESDATGIDAPLGWPRRFIAALAAWDASLTWPEPWEAEAYAGPCVREPLTDGSRGRSCGHRSNS